MGIKEFFASEFETSDNHQNSKLQTHYYRCRYEDAKEAVLQMIKTFKGQNIIVNDEFQEISFQTSRFTGIVSIVNTRPTEAAIDIKLSFNSISFGKGFKIIEDMYLNLDKKLPFKGTGLYKG